MNAAETAYRLLVDSGTVIVVDVETCPADDGDHIIAIAAVTCRQGRKRSTWSKILDPGVPITNSQHHGLTDSDVAGADTFADVVDELDQILSEPDAYLVAHNATFDVGRLHLEYSRLASGQSLRELPVLDTMKLPAALGHAMPGRSRSLAAACTHFGVVNSQAHNAASDAIATADVLHALLRVTAGPHLDLASIHEATNCVTTSLIPQAEPEPATFRSTHPELPVEHLATHTTLIGPEATDADLEAWVAAAVDCARLRCPLLHDKARTAVRYGMDLHPRLTVALQSNSFEAGQGATLVGAINVLAPFGIDSGKNKTPILTWWRKQGPLVKALARCDVQRGECPDCRNGDPCPIDLAHHPAAEAILLEPDGTIPADRREMFMKEGRTKAMLPRWIGLGLHDLAGYAAALVIDAYRSGGNSAQADRILVLAVTLGATDVRLTHQYAERLALHGRDADAAKLVHDALANRTTDAAFDDLALWHARWRARAASRPRPDPNPKPGSSVRKSRPAGRVRPRRFAV